MTFLLITVDECLRASEADLSRDLCMQLGGIYPAGQSVQLKFPVLSQLQQHLLEQSYGSTAGTRDKQQTAVAQSHRECQEAAAMAGEILHEVSKRYGSRAAARACCNFLSYRLMHTARFVARHQLAGKALPGTEWLAFVPSEVVHPRKVVHINGAASLVRLTIQRESERTSLRLYVPAHTLPGEHEVMAWQIPLDVWVDYVIPQCAAQKGLFGSIYSSWMPESKDQVFEDDVDMSLLGPPLTDGSILCKQVIQARALGDEARALLHAVTDPPASSEGPLTFLSQTHLSALSLHLIRVKQSVERIDERIWRAPSVWHATVWLKDLLGWDRKGRPLSSRPMAWEAEWASLPKGPFLFRGQANSSWLLTPTLHREPSDAARTALARFVQAIAHLANESDGISQIDLALAGIAQHYGMETTLLDFTFDPRIAAYFACDSKDTETTEAAIYMLPLARAYERGGVVVLPPPWVERVHRQLGCFVDCEYLNAFSPGGLKDDCVCIRFPRDPKYCTSDIVRNQGPIYPESQWLTEAIKWSRSSQSLEFPPSSVVDEIDLPRLLANDLLKVAGKPTFLFEGALPAVAERHLSLALEIVKWAAVSLDTDGEKFQLDCAAIRSLALHNPGLFSAFSEAGRVTRAAGVSPATSGTGGLLASIIECMEDSVEDPVSAIKHA